MDIELIAADYGLHWKEAERVWIAGKGVPLAHPIQGFLEQDGTLTEQGREVYGRIEKAVAARLRSISGYQGRLVLI